MLLFAQLIILVILVILDIWLGLVKGAYFNIWWWDIPTHFLGGVWAGLFAAWILRKYAKGNLILQCAAIALAIGIGWEIFEYAFGIGGSIFMGYWADTIKDLCMDTLGGAAAGAVAYLERDLWRK
jgi:uncharacterized membrane protein YjdF